VKKTPEESPGAHLRRTEELKDLGRQICTAWVSSGFKSRPGNYSFTPVVLRSSIQVIECCKFREGKATGRNASESVLALLTIGDVDL